MSGSQHLFFGLLALALAAGCRFGPEPDPRRAGGEISAAAKREAAPGPSAKDLDARGLEKRWDFCLEEPIEALTVIDDAIYVYTAERNLYAIGLENGLVRWQYGLPDGLSSPPFVYIYPAQEGIQHTDEVILVSKDTLHVVDRAHGFLLWKIKLDFPVSSPPSASYSHIYLGSWNGRIYAISKADHTIDWSYLTGGPVTARAEASGPEKSVEAVFVASEDGRVYSFTPTAEERKWWYRTQGPITTPPFFFKTYLFVGSQDFNVYCIRTIDGGLEWRYAAGAPVKRTPVAFSEGDAVYVIAGESSLVALNRRPQKQNYVRWKYEGGVQVLAKGRRDVYILDKKGRVVAIGEETGKPRWAEPLAPGADFFALDPWDPASLVEREKRLASTIVFGYRDGWLVAAREKAEY
jgi:outer membrane protein assembly factor BamB